MNTVQADFEKRCNEIDTYLGWLVEVEVSPKQIPAGLPATMKAAAVLLLYNLVESTMTNAVEAVFDELENRKVSFDVLRSEFKIAVIQNVKNCAANKLTTRMAVVATDIIGASFDKAKVFNGNVDARRIRETLSELGVEKTHNYEEAKLHEIMTARNSLAHGAESFADYGKDLTAPQLVRDFQAVRTLLGHVLLDFASYINDRRYLGIA